MRSGLTRCDSALPDTNFKKQDALEKQKRRTPQVGGVLLFCQAFFSSSNTSAMSMSYMCWSIRVTMLL